jgi:hypothetical protein
MRQPGTVRTRLSARSSALECRAASEVKWDGDGQRRRLTLSPYCINAALKMELAASRPVKAQRCVLGSSIAERAEKELSVESLRACLPHHGSRSTNSRLEQALRLGTGDMNGDQF